jgi:hypothetical protein
MKNFILFLVCTSLALVLLACARPNITLDRVIVQNDTAGKITEVKVRHEPTRRFGKVSAILPQRSLEIGLGRVQMLAQQAVVSWRDSEGRKWSVELEIPYDRSVAQAGRHMSLIYTIITSGRVTAHLQASSL